MIDRLLTESLLGWTNRLLRREEWARAALAPYAGRSARFVAGPVAIAIAVAPDGMLAAASAEAGAPTVTITLTQGTVAALVAAPGPFAEAVRANLRIEGDTVFAQALTDVLQRLRPDPVEDLARVVGDVAAERIAGAARAAAQAARDGVRRAARQAADYVVAENPMVLGAQEWSAFRADLASLVRRLEGLEERVAAREAAHPAAPPR